MFPRRHGRISSDSTDAVNGSQLYATNQAIANLSNTVNASTAHYYSVNDGGVQGGNYNNDGASGINAVASGVNASASGQGSVAMGADSTATGAGSVAMGWQLVYQVRCRALGDSLAGLVMTPSDRGSFGGSLMSQRRQEIEQKKDPC